MKNIKKKIAVLALIAFVAAGVGTISTMGIGAPLPENGCVLFFR